MAAADDDDVVAHAGIVARFVDTSRAVAYRPPKGGHYESDVSNPSRLHQGHHVNGGRAGCRAAPCARPGGADIAAPSADAAAIELANDALNAARGAGASYADVRIGRYRRQQSRRVSVRCRGHRQRVMRPWRADTGQRLLGFRRDERHDPCRRTEAPRSKPSSCHGPRVRCRRGKSSWRRSRR